MSECLGVYINVCVYDEHGLQVIINCWGRQIAILPMPTGNVSLLYFLLLRIAELYTRESTDSMKKAVIEHFKRSNQPSGLS